MIVMLASLDAGSCSCPDGQVRNCCPLLHLAGRNRGCSFFDKGLLSSSTSKGKSSPVVKYVIGDHADPNIIAMPIEV